MPNDYDGRHEITVKCWHWQSQFCKVKFGF